MKQLVIVKHVRITPTIQLSLIKNKLTGEQMWRERYQVAKRGGRNQVIEDYAFDKFESIEKFKEHIEEQPMREGQIYI
jgi:hypothetical protein